MYDFPEDVKPDMEGGLFWVKKRGKECMAMITEADWEKAKEVYSDKKGIIGDVHLAVGALVVKKRVQASSEEETEDKEVAAPAAKKVNLAAAADFNKTQASVIRFVNQKGTADRYNADHIRVWTDLIMEGKLAGPQEEPCWDKYLDAVHFLPRSDPPSRRTQGFDLQQYFFLSDERQQKRDDAFRNQMMMMLMAGRQPQLQPQPQVETLNATRQLLTWSSLDVSNFLRANNLEKYCKVFQDNEVDGPTMSSMTDEALKDLGVSCALDRCKILGKFKKM